MLLFRESGVGYTTEWTWVDNGKYPIISFGNFVFLDKFLITSSGTPLVEGKDYIRILRSKQMEMKFGLDIFAGVVLLSTNSQVLDIYGVVSAEDADVLPIDTIDPYSVSLYSSVDPMDGSYQDVINIIDEIEILMPQFRGVDLPTYLKLKLGTVMPRLSQTIGISIAYHPIALRGIGDIEAMNSISSARSDMIGIDAIPLDSGYFEYDTRVIEPNISLSRVNVIPLNSLPLGTTIINQNETMEK